MARHENQISKDTGIEVKQPKARDGLLSNTIKTCKCCKKEFNTFGTTHWTYKVGSVYYCSYKCYRARRVKNDKRKDT